MGFQLVLGNRMESTEGLFDSYELSCENEGCIEAVLSAEKLEDFIGGYVRLLDEPLFFFVEIPCSESEEKSLGGDRLHYKLYYLDNCTLPVIEAVIKKYGFMLINDGLSRFGFGANEQGDEIYIKSYKVISVYCSEKSRLRRTANLLDRLGAVQTERLVTPWDLIGPENPGECISVEEEDYGIDDLPELLKDAGMYYAETISS